MGCQNRGADGGERRRRLFDSFFAKDGTGSRETWTLNYARERCHSNLGGRNYFRLHGWADL